MRPGAPRLAEVVSCRLLLVLIVCCPGIPANQQGTKKTLTIGYLAAMTVSRLLVVIWEHIVLPYQMFSLPLSFMYRHPHPPTYAIKKLK